jgi:hypothetical protein
MVDPTLYAGFSAGKGLLPWLIRKATGGSVNHAFLLWEDPQVGWVTLGANEDGVSRMLWGEFTLTRTVPAIFMPTDPAKSLWAGLEALKAEIGAKYNIPALVGMSIVEVAAHLFHERVDNPLDFNKREVFCSEFQAQVIRASGFRYFPNQPADTIDPEEGLAELSNRIDFMKGVVPSVS